jgi:hypothetical protein
MRKFEEGVKVRVVDVADTRSAGYSIRENYIGSEGIVDGCDRGDNTYYVDFGGGDSGKWVLGSELELVKEEVNVEEKTFEVGDEVLVVNLTATEESILGINSQMVCGNKLTVKEESPYHEGAYILSDNWSYMGVDLQLVEDKVQIEGEIEPGDTVEVIKNERSKREFQADLEVGDYFVVAEVDLDDMTAVNDDDDWFYLNDLKLVSKAGAEEDELEDPFAPVKERDINFLITRDSVTLSIDGNSEVASFDHVNFTVIRTHVLDNEFDEAMALMNVSVGIQNWGQGSLKIEDGKVVYVGMELTGKLVDRIIEMMVGGDTAFERFAKFLSKAMEQQSFTTRGRIMDFAAAGDIELDEDGCIIAFKNVRSDFKDKHSGTFDYSVGATPSMARHLVDDNHDKACSQGLHICSINYLKGFWGCGGKTVRVKVDPRDIVGIPYDYKDSKARVCKMEVIEDITDRLSDFGL